MELSAYFDYQSPPSPHPQVHMQMSRNGVGFPLLRDRTMETNHETEDILYSVQNEII